MNRINELTGREKALIQRGYSANDVLLFSRVEDEFIEETAEKIFAELTQGVVLSEKPVCVYIGAQPGCGKSTLIRRVKSGRLGAYYVDLAMDNYRSFHPMYQELEDIICSHWEERKETPDDSPGSDIADFTQYFAGTVVDTLEEMVSIEKRYNILYEWAMRSAQEPLASMRRLKGRGYRINVKYIAVNAEVSLAACRRRSVIMNSKGRVFRAIPDSFHALSVERIPQACNEIYTVGYMDRKDIDSFSLIDRSGNVLWRTGDSGLPGDFLSEILRNGPRDIENRDSYSEDAYERESRGFEI